MLLKIVLFLIGTLLGASMALGAFRWLGGESFLPNPGGDGTVEEDRHPSSLGGFVKGYVSPLVCGAVALPLMLPTSAGASTWLWWVVFGGGCLIVLRFGRNRGWY